MVKHLLISAWVSQLAGSSADQSAPPFHPQGCRASDVEQFTQSQQLLLCDFGCAMSEVGDIWDRWVRWNDAGDMVSDGNGWDGWDIALG